MIAPAAHAAVPPQPVLDWTLESFLNLPESPGGLNMSTGTPLVALIPTAVILDGSPNPATSSRAKATPVSTAFYPGAPINAGPEDVILVSRDLILFYTHSRILDSSSNRFNGLHSLRRSGCGTASAPRVVSVPEDAQVLNVLLHFIYDIDCVRYSPAFALASSALQALPRYGFDVKSAVAPGRKSFDLFLHRYAPAMPMEVYALAGAHDLMSLAVAASAHLHAFPLPSIDDALAERMGARYLRRLFFLHLGRTDALKRLLLAPPEQHLPSPVCSVEEQRELTRAWALACAYIGWAPRPSELPGVTAILPVVLI
ncbi:hypothetical protein PUNSTDRAFT_43997 [Punctularia strigosozonata HHB-11173 SS5]|uniref:uncharacterized protein n=1 Tax=Punctularia strigosozonata (strain HHB-11173) TaxID=741275 RepID=UPI0004417782|nr:uncharacterized protein PUNSTDRAFT_43997 [Punctularia strigosozonata HHB-11173 SS5]EIN09700.1 hypothetical protein PUNSTDRAFT_43997 [Punctularia strigosozonata HHB-11173 SS5]